MQTEEQDLISVNPEHPPSRKEREIQKRRIGRITRHRMGLLLAILGALTAIVRFRLGAEFWPLWLVAAQTLLGGLLLFFFVFLLLLAPIIVEFEKDPRALSGSKVPWYLHGRG